MSAFVMPQREAEDGAIGVRRVDKYLVIDVTTDGKLESVLMSEYNAVRIFGCLAVMLGVPLPKVLGKAIKLGNASALVGPTKKPKNLGEALASSIRIDHATEKLRAAGFDVERTSELPTNGQKP